MVNIFKEFEGKLEGLFEGVFLRAFKSGVQPVELGKKLVRELEGHKTIGVARVYVPNRYEIGLSAKDYARFESYQAVMATELENLLISYIKEKGYAVLDRPRTRMVEVARLREGEFWIKCTIEGELPPERPEEPHAPGIVQRSPAAGPVVLEMLDTGEVSPLFDLERETVSIGRTGENGIVLPDPNVSRLHARVEKRGDRYYVVDQGSTNGTWVNEKRVDEARLSEGDVIRVGTTRLMFRRSNP
jgi:hypothetical protein